MSERMVSDCPLSPWRFQGNSFQSHPRGVGAPPKAAPVELKGTPLKSPGWLGHSDTLHPDTLKDPVKWALSFTVSLLERRHCELPGTCLSRQTPETPRYERLPCRLR